MRAAALCLAVLAMGVPRSSHAELVTAGSGDKTLMVRSQFPDEQKPRFDLFAVKCTKCHAMARPIAALQTGVSPVTGGEFNQDTLKKYVVKMMRKPNSGIAKDDAKEILSFLTFALTLTEAQRAKTPTSPPVEPTTAPSVQPAPPPPEN